jgi:hypothetical protein
MSGVAQVRAPFIIEKILIEPANLLKPSLEIYF